MPRVTTASRWLLLLSLVLACLAVPAGAAAQIGSVSINPVVTGTLGSNGWYVSNVHVVWQFTPAPDNTQGCDTRTITTEGRTHLDCKAQWGTVHVDYPLDLSIDKTAPTVHGVASRKPDANRWYNKPVSFRFTGTDKMSGLASCSATSYKGPDNAHASVAGTCKDRAGNVGHAVYRFSYDSTPPTVGSVTAAHGNRSVMLRWADSADTQSCEVTRSSDGKSDKVIYRGTDQQVKDKKLKVGAKYQYTVTAFDEAENKAAASTAVTATGALTSPLPGESVTARPHLSWLSVKGASYYNVQLVRGGRILSRWPERTSLNLRRSWVYHGHRYRLHRGVYRWYVWPGFGKPAQGRFGKLLGSSSFVYAP